MICPSLFAGKTHQNDISVFSDSQDDHERHVRGILETLWVQGFRLKGKKYAFGTPEVGSVGFGWGSEEQIRAI